MGYKRLSNIQQGSYHVEVPGPKTPVSNVMQIKNPGLPAKQFRCVPHRNDQKGSASAWLRKVRYNQALVLAAQGDESESRLLVLAATAAEAKVAP